MEKKVLILVLLNVIMFGRGVTVWGAVATPLELSEQVSEKCPLCLEDVSAHEMILLHRSFSSDEELCHKACLSCVAQISNAAGGSESCVEVYCPLCHHLIPVELRGFFEKTEENPLFQMCRLIESNDEEKLCELFSLQSPIGLIRMINTKINWKNPGRDETVAPLLYALRKGYVGIAHLLITKGAIAHCVDDVCKETPLHRAAASGFFSLVELLIKNKALINCKDVYGQTPLHVAAINGCLSIVELLVKNGVVIDDKNRADQTSLELAIRNDQSSVVEFLLKNGANPMISSEKGLTPFHWALQQDKGKEIMLFLEKVIEVNLQDERGLTPLHYASEYGNFPLVEFLLKKGADPHIRDNKGNRALEYAILGGHFNVFNLLLDETVALKADSESKRIRLS